jgi:hypothetical protein
MERTDVVIAGVNKAGTTSLYVSLAEHPDVAASAIKETRFFLPPRYGEPLPPRQQWEDYFTPGPPVRLEATPSYFYGGTAVATAMRSVLTNPRIVLVLREPVARAISFFEYQKVRLRFPESMTMAEYLAEVDAIGDAVGSTPETEKYMAVLGGEYARWLPEWWDVMGRDAVRIEWFDAMTADAAGVVRGLGDWLGLDPAGLPTELRSENRTTAFKHARLQKAALWFNDSSERMLRRMPGVKRGLRSLYYRVNGSGAPTVTTSDALRAELAERFVEPNARLAALLDDAGIARPAWLA